MPDIGRTPTQDPLTTEFPSMSPYFFFNNNPIYYTDPTGMSSSPIYDELGTFLGTDSEGFKGEAIFMSRSTFNLNGGYNNGTDGSQKAGISHQTAMAVGQTLDGVIGDNPSTTFTQGEINMVNNAITHIVSQTQGMSSNTSDLHNGKASSSYFEQGNMNATPQIPQVALSANDGSLQSYSVANTNPKINQNALVSYNLNEFRTGHLTVENIQNTWVHEKGGHYDKNIPGGHNTEHAKAIINQSQHPSWKRTTEAFKANIRSVYESYTGKPLNR